MRMAEAGMLVQRGKSYSQDLRERVFALCDAGDGVGEIAEALCVSASYVSKVLSRWRKTGERSARPQRCHLAPKLLGLHDAIRAEVLARPDATLAELRRWLSQTHQASASDALMHGTLVRLGLTYKKRPCTLPSRSGRMLPRHAPRGASSSQA